jgi:hypothetical protein
MALHVYSGDYTLSAATIGNTFVDIAGNGYCIARGQSVQKGVVFFFGLQYFRAQEHGIHLVTALEAMHQFASSFDNEKLLLLAVRGFLLQ